MSTQESCFQAGSEPSGAVTEMDGEDGPVDGAVSWLVGIFGWEGHEELCSCVGVGIKSSSWPSINICGVSTVSGTFRPLTPQASTGSITTSRK